MTPLPDPEVVGPAHAPIPAPAVKKIRDVTDRIKWDLTPELREPEFLEKVKRLLGHIINEGTTDILIDVMKAFVPWPGVGWAFGKILDTLLPDRLLQAVYAILDRLSD